LFGETLDVAINVLFRYLSLRVVGETKERKKEERERERELSFGVALSKAYKQFINSCRALSMCKTLTILIFHCSVLILFYNLCRQTE
jgi:hypothetical protein